MGEISDAILSTSRETIPVKSYQKHVRPGWTPELSNAHRLSKSAWFRWKSAGKPSSATHPAKVEYKEAKRSFRHLLKQLHNEQRFRFYNDINENLKDADRLFGLLRAHAGTQPTLTNSILVDGREFCSDDIQHGWANYFEELGTPIDDFEDESAFHHIIDNKIEQILSGPPQEHKMLSGITPEEVGNIIDSFSLKKAPGPDDIQPEHLRYGGSLLFTKLAQLFNALAACNYIPIAFQLGYIVPILKSRDKDPSNPSNYRGITLLSTVSKVFEKVILNRLYYHGIGEHIHRLQGGFQAGLSSLHSAFVLQETIASIREQKKRAYICCSTRCEESI